MEPFSAELEEKIEIIKRLKKNIKSYRVSPRKRLTALESSLLRYASHSIAIESVKVNPKTLTRMLFASAYLTNIDYRTLTIKKILKAHAMLKPHKKGVGKFRDYDVEIKGPYKNPSRPVAFQNVPEKMEKFVKCARKMVKKGKLPEVVQAALIKLFFLLIHPFNDGNGRISRMLLNGVLKKYGYPPVTVPVSEIKKYYLCIHKADKKSKLNPYLVFICDCVISSMENLLNELKK